MPTTYTGTDANETFTGTDDSEIFHTGGGNDVVDSYGGDDTIFGEGGNDALAGGHGDDSISGGDGDDWILGGSINVTGTDTADGGAGNDTITATAAGVMYGGDGVDELHWLSITADPVLLGITSEAQPGHFEGFYVVPEVVGGVTYVFVPRPVVVDGIERILASTGAGNDTVSGGALNDEIHVYQGDNEAYGFGGNDTLSYSAGGASTLDGGEGDDVAMVRPGALGDFVFTVAPDGSAGDNHGAVITNVERFSLALYTGDDWAQLGAGADTAYADSGDDTMLGGGGQDSLHGGDGADSLAGEADADTLFGAHGDDSLSGGDGTDTVKGGVGDDTLSGGAGADLLDGGDGADLLDGGEGNDKLRGNLGADTLVGGLGADALNGGLGADVFRFLAPSESTVQVAGRDTIKDFAPGDRIDLSAIDANGGLAGDPLFAFIGTAAFSAPGQIRAVAQGGNTIVQVNIAGTGGAEMAIRLNGLHALTESDFIR